MPRRLPARMPLIASMLLLAIALTAGCGFQPRGQTAGPAGAPGLPDQIQIRGLATYNDLYRELDRQLEVAGTEVLTTATEGAVRLQLSGVRSDSRLLSVNSRNRAVEYELIEEATFALQSPEGQQLIAPQHLRVLRIQYRPQVAVLGSDREAQLLRRDMREELAGRIIRRLAAQQGATP